MTIVNFIIAILSILSIGVISLTFFIDIDPELTHLLEYFDILLCLFFFGDFINQFAQAKNKWRYFYTYGWIDLLSSIPVVNEFRYARFLRVFRVLRLVESLKLLTDFFKKNKQETVYGTVLLLMILSIFTCTFFILYLEKDIGNIQTAEDSLWWTFITITTVGYGDYYPVTNEGKLIASFLIINGLVGFGTLISFLNGSIDSLKKTR
jgi:voltage-gated potassium channel